MNIGKYLAAFIGGATVGAGIGYIIIHEKERKRADEEIRDVREYYHNRTEKKHEELARKAEDIKAEGKMIREAQKKLERMNTPYTTFSDEGMSAEEFRATLQSPKDDPQVYDISAEDFINGAITYDKVSLRLFEGDGVVVDENDEPVIADDLIGVDNLNRLIDGEEDGLYLRDEDKEVDYEIDKVEGSYSELTGDI